jgi:hypothetical protein
MLMFFFKERNESDCHFVVFAPDWWAGERNEWTLRAFVSGRWVRELKVPLIYPTQLGVDVSDVQTMEAAFEAMVREVLAEAGRPASSGGPSP